MGGQFLSRGITSNNSSNNQQIMYTRIRRRRSNRIIKSHFNNSSTNKNKNSSTNHSHSQIINIHKVHPMTLRIKGSSITKISTINRITYLLFNLWLLRSNKIISIRRIQLQLRMPLLCTRDNKNINNNQRNSRLIHIQSQPPHRNQFKILLLKSGYN